MAVLLTAENVNDSTALELLMNQVRVLRQGPGGLKWLWSATYPQPSSLGS